MSQRLGQGDFAMVWILSGELPYCHVNKNPSDPMAADLLKFLYLSNLHQAGFKVVSPTILNLGQPRPTPLHLVLLRCLKRSPGVFRALLDPRKANNSFMDMEKHRHRRHE